MMPLLGKRHPFLFAKKTEFCGGGLFLCVSFVFRECPMFAVKFFFHQFLVKSL